MTKITYSRKDRKYELVIKGHAGDERVCASISTLVFLLETVLADEESAGSLESFKLDEAPGNVLISTEVGKRRNAEISNYFEWIIKGYEALAATYPNNIILKKGGD